MTTTALDNLFAPYEARVPRGPAAAIAARHAGMAFGRHLNRIQGREPTEPVRRLTDLFVTGRISTEEYADLAVTAARWRALAGGRGPLGE